MLVSLNALLTITIKFEERSPSVLELYKYLISLFSTIENNKVGVEVSTTILIIKQPHKPLHISFHKV